MESPGKCSERKEKATDEKRRRTCRFAFCAIIIRRLGNRRKRTTTTTIVFKWLRIFFLKNLENYGKLLENIVFAGRLSYYNGYITSAEKPSRIETYVYQWRLYTMNRPVCGTLCGLEKNIINYKNGMTRRKTQTIRNSSSSVNNNIIYE